MLSIKMHSLANTILVLRERIGLMVEGMLED
jgi:hypothetical protein